MAFWVSERERVCACKTSGFGRFLTLLSSVCSIAVFITQKFCAQNGTLGKQRKRRIEVNGRNNMRKTFLLSFSTLRMGIFICCFYFISFRLQFSCFFLSSIRSLFTRRWDCVFFKTTEHSRMKRRMNHSNIHMHTHLYEIWWALLLNRHLVVRIHEPHKICIQLEITTEKVNQWNAFQWSDCVIFECDKIRMQPKCVGLVGFIGRKCEPLLVK